MKLSLEIKGVRDVTQKLDQVTEDIRGSAFRERGMGRALQILLDQARQEVPKYGGKLEQSLEKDIEKNGRETIGTVGSALFYAGFNERGTGTFAGNSPYRPPAGRIHGWAVDHGFQSGTRLAKAIFNAGGTRPSHFLRNTLEKKGEEAVAELGDVVMEIVEK